MVLMPHQIAPVGDWIYWMLYGGRGIGKTGGGAHWLNQHVLGPPCDENLPGGHRPAIIAPSLGDAVESCVEGPVGLRVQNPAIRLVTSRGGTHVVWPNGAKAKLFGTYTKEDIERLRAGGNRCLEAGTVIVTSRGEVPIELVNVGDRVLTRSGYRHVIASKQTGVEPLWEMRTEDGRVLRGSAEHPILTDRGWVALAELSQGFDNVLVWQASRGVATGGGNVPTGTSPAASSRTGRSCFTGRSTKRLMARSRRAITSITATATRPITAWRTWSASLLASISPVTLAMQTGTGRVRSRQLPPNGPPLGSAKSAALGTSRRQRPQGSALLRVPSVITSGRRLVVATRTASASSAGERSARDEKPRLARVRVRAVSPTGTAAPVYNLQVADDPEYLANGILTHNCAIWAEEFAAWRYLEQAWPNIELGLRLGVKPRGVITSTPKNRPLFKKLLKAAHVTTTHARTEDNPHLPEERKRILYEQYEGTRLGQQELEGLVIEDVEGALWTTQLIEKVRVPESEREGIIERLNRIIVSVDPSTGSGAGDECGIVVVGRGNDQLGYVLEDASMRGTPDEWGERVVSRYEHWKADGVLVETNFHAQLVRMVMRSAAPSVPIMERNTSRGKAVRAEPVLALYEKTPPRVLHLGTFPKLEEQMTSWIPPGSEPEGEEPSGFSPDRMDALVWGLTEVVLNYTPAKVASAKNRRSLPRYR